MRAIWQKISRILFSYCAYLFKSHQCSACFAYLFLEDKGGLESFLCSSCLSSIYTSAPFFIKKKSLSIRVHTFGVYTGALEILINKKYARDPQPFWVLGKVFAQVLKNSLEEFDYIVPMPLHPFKRGARWFNQSEELAYAMSKILKIPVLKALTRVKNTAPQVRMRGLFARRKNIEGAFEIKKKCILEGKRVLLVDDVYTSGATLGEAIDTLLRVKPLSVEAAVLARTLA